MYIDIINFCKVCECCCILKLFQFKVRVFMDYLFVFKLNELLVMDFIILEKVLDGRENVLVIIDVFLKFIVVVLIRD